VRTWEAEYRPTKKNQQVEKFWDTLGFHVANVTQGVKKYVMDEGERKSGIIEFIKIQEP
jgi:predicted enzyme involved in methoxymalonyl-ACP biosynthesis